MGRICYLRKPRLPVGLPLGQCLVWTKEDDGRRATVSLRRMLPTSQRAFRGLFTEASEQLYETVGGPAPENSEEDKQPELHKTLLPRVG
ncbi:hypothetical protein VULLAG_LOCUS20173 [Vulpes lagopus]